MVLPCCGTAACRGAGAAEWQRGGDDDDYDGHAMII